MKMKTRIGLGIVLAFSWTVASAPTRADVVTDWNQRASEVIVAAQLPPPPTARTIAIVQTAVYEAVNTIARDRTNRAKSGAVDAAVAAANRVTLSQLIPAQRALIDNLYQAALALIPDGAAKEQGIAAGEKAGAAVLARRANDGADAPEDYRPRTTPGVYVPTTIPQVPQWARRKPWVMSRADQFRPGPPPSLDSDVWARDYNEIRAMGAKDSPRRTAEQTEIAKFWETRGAGIYFPLVHSVANARGRTVVQNARLFATATQAMDDALIAVFDAKYHYGFWRPVTAIRNGDQDGNDATELDASWVPFIETPMHPEYPCAHCIVAASIGTVLQAEIGNRPTPQLTTTSPTAAGKARSWTRVNDLIQEVANARIYDGVHYRNSTEVGVAMGRKIGALAVQKRDRVAGAE